MVVYRIGKAQYSNDLSGEGARLFGGRWNRVGVPCLYTSQSRALALLEFSVNVGFDFIPPNLSFSVIEIEDNAIDELAFDDLPQNWRAVPSGSETKLYGSEKLKNSLFPVLKVPSVILPTEFNFILNPAHNGSSVFKIIGIEPFEYDYRIKK